MNRFSVDTAKLEKAAAQLDQQAQDFQNHYKQLLLLTGNMGSAWQGEDSLEFANQIKGPLDDLRKMHSTMKDYAEFLQYCSKVYRSAQKDVLAAAKSL